MRNLTATGILAVAYLLVGGCSGYDDPIGPTNTNSGNGATGTALPGTNVALFEPVTGLLLGTLPFPTDLYFANTTDGTLNIQPPNAFSPNQASLNAMDGFSTNAVIREPFGGALKASSLTAGSIVIIPVVTDNLQHLATVGIAGPPLVLGTDFTAAPAADAPSILEITPLHPLMPSTCVQNGMFLGASCTKSTGYLVVLNNGITDASGNAAVPDADYATIQKALATGSCKGITNATLNGICQLVGAHMQVIAGAAQAFPPLAPALNPANIVLTFSFTTESTTDTLQLLYEKTAAIAKVQPPTLVVQPAIVPTPMGPVQITTNTPPLPGLGKANLYVGVLSIPYYLSKSDPLNGSWQAPPSVLDPTSTFVTRFNPLPVATQTLQIPVLMSVPNSIPGPWPVLIFQHGITRNREDMIAVADSFGELGFVVAAIDIPLHGITSNVTADPFYASAANPVYKGLGLPATQMSIERTFDLMVQTPGTIDPSGTNFINFTNALTLRDNFREAAADLFTFELALPNLAIPASSNVIASTLAPAPLHFLGHSLGAMVGSVLLGVIPATDITSATLANPGGNITVLTQNSPTFGPLVNAGLEAKGVAPGTTLYAQYFRDFQTVIDSGDPINYIAIATAQHPIHLLQVVGAAQPPAGCGPGPMQLPGCPDQVIPNSATAALITASKYAPPPLAPEMLTRIKAPAAPGALFDTMGTPPGFRAFLNFTQGDHGSIIDNKVPAVTAEMQGEAISFTGSAVPPAGLPATTPGTAILISDPLVIQP
jgi:hypothetical protein